MSIEEQINFTIEQSLNQRMKVFDKGLADITGMMQNILQIVNLQTYTLHEASQKTGIGYKKLRNAIVRGELPSIPDEKITRIRHIDLNAWLEKKKFKIIE